MRLHQRRILANCLRMELYRRSHPGALAGGAAAELWGRYAGELFQVDAWYRQLVCDLTRCVRRPPVSSGDDLGGELVAALDEAIRALAASAERLYKGWFLEGLGSAWSSAVQGDLARLGHVDGAPPARGLLCRGGRAAARARRGSGRRHHLRCAALRGGPRARGAARAPDARHLRALRPRAPLPSITSLGMASLLPPAPLAIDDAFRVRWGGGSFPAPRPPSARRSCEAPARRRGRLGTRSCSP